MEPFSHDGHAFHEIHQVRTGLSVELVDRISFQNGLAINGITQVALGRGWRFLQWDPGFGLGECGVWWMSFSSHVENALHAIAQTASGRR